MRNLNKRMKREVTHVIIVTTWFFGILSLSSVHPLRFNDNILTLVSRCIFLCKCNIRTVVYVWAFPFLIMVTWNNMGIRKGIQLQISVSELIALERSPLSCYLYICTYTQRWVHVYTCTCTTNISGHITDHCPRGIHLKVVLHFFLTYPWLYI